MRIKSTKGIRNFLQYILVVLANIKNQNLGGLRDKSVNTPTKVQAIPCLDRCYRFHNNRTRLPDLFFCDRQGWRNAQAISSEKEPVGNDAVFYTAVDDLFAG